MSKRPEPAVQRLQKLLAAAGVCSRRQAEVLIESGRVTVNGRIAGLGEQADPRTDRIEVDGRPLKGGGPPCYLLMHKPVGVVTTLSDPAGRPVITDLLQGLPSRVYPVGRLDLTTSGLILLTNDGELAHRLAHPSGEVSKSYLVRVRGVLTAEVIQRLEGGVELDDGPTAPARVTHVRRRGGHSWFELTIHEGRNRQVRRMCEAVGLPVSRLMRIGYAFLTLGDLAPGQYRHLTSAEVACLKRLCSLPD